MTANLDELLEQVITGMKQHFHEDVLAGDVRPQFALLCKTDLQGAPMERGLGLIVVVPQSFDDDDDKDHLAMTLRAISVAGEAVASVSCMDTWAVFGDDAEDVARRNIAPSDHPCRVEAMSLIVERADRPVVSMTATAYKRLDDTVTFEDSRTESFPADSAGGRMLGLVARERPHPDSVKKVRALIAMGALGSFEVRAL